MAREIALIFVILLGFCVQGLNAFLLRSAFVSEITLSRCFSYDCLSLDRKIEYPSAE